MVILGHDGSARFERGLVRAEDVLASPETEGGDGGSGDDAASEERGADGVDASSGLESEPPSADSGAPLSDRLIIDLSAHKTMGLRDALQTQPILALTAVVHALALSVFYPAYDPPTPLQVRLIQTGLERAAPGVAESPAGRRVAARGETWAVRLPDKAADLWTALVNMSGSDFLDLLAYCAGLSVQAVRDPHDRYPAAWAQAEVLAAACGLDMVETWTATAASYFGRVSKARVLEAVGEAVDPEQAWRLAGMKKADMAEAAEGLVAGTGWLPPLLRTAPANPQGEATAPDDPDHAEGQAGDPDAYPFAAE